MACNLRAKRGSASQGFDMSFGCIIKELAVSSHDAVAVRPGRRRNDPIGRIAWRRARKKRGVDEQPGRQFSKSYSGRGKKTLEPINRCHRKPQTATRNQ